MIKSYVKHRTFETFQMPTGDLETFIEVVIEADEAYIQVITPGVIVSLTRSRDRELLKVLQAAGISKDERQPFLESYVSLEMGAVSIDNLISADYSAYHPPVRQDMYSRKGDDNPYCGIRDRLHIKYGDHNLDQETFAFVLETVHYVPADHIGI